MTCGRDGTYGRLTVLAVRVVIAIAVQLCFFFFRHDLDFGQEGVQQLF